MVRPIRWYLINNIYINKGNNNKLGFFEKPNKFVDCKFFS